MSAHRFSLNRVILTLWLSAVAAGAFAQTSTSALRGRVTDEQGNAFPTAEIVATNTGTGYRYTATAGSDGGYILGGLTPGVYTLEVSAPSYRGVTKEVRVLIGQTVEADFRLRPDLVLMEEVTVVGSTPVEMETSEVATNVTTEQIENLPQGNRNFMNFASLAPGMRVIDQEFSKTFASGAQSANAVNVFIDGVSFKNDILTGGVVGQDSSRGNPFPQNAVQEFRVLTQNYSAEYQKSSSAVITAVTKSGTNDMKGDAFVFYQDKDLVARDPFSAANAPRPEYERTQMGLSVGGPVIRDRMHYFLSYESNNEDRARRVTVGGTNHPIRSQFLQHEGLFTSPFELQLLFGKLTFQPGSQHLLDFSGYLRDETDIRNFGDQTAFDAAEDVAQEIWQAALRHQFTQSTWLNEASISMQSYTWNPRPLDSNSVGLDYQGLLRIGGRDTEQNFTQERLSFRDDITFAGWNWRGRHAVKVGGNADVVSYDVFKDFAGNPVYRFRASDNFEFPFEASYGLGNPDLSGDNTQLGLYAQDDWSINDHATLNLGMRWDYESDMLPSDYETPAEIRQKFGPFFDDNYFSDGDDREPITDMFAPRLGFTYDLRADSKTVFFGGIGRYYDRVLFNNSLDERFRLQFSVGTFRFSRDGAPRDGFPTVVWNDRYLTEAGLQELLATGTTGNPEVFLLENDTKAPYSDQWNLGVRQAFGDYIASLSYASIRSYNGFSFIFGNRRPNGDCCVQLVPGFSNVLLSTDDVKTWYDAIYFKLDKPFASDSRWSGSLAYTYSDATQIGGDLFSLDFPTIEDYPRYPTETVPDHQLVASVLWRLPWDVSFGSVLSYNSGTRFNIDDQSAGGGPNQRRFLRNEGTEDEDTIIDLRLEKTFRLGGFGFGIIGEAFNVLDDKLYGGYEGFIPTLPNTNPRFGQPTHVRFGSGRRYQVGARFTF